MYLGAGAFDIIGKRRRWYAFFGLVVLVCVASIVFRGFVFSIDFSGGTQIQMPAAGARGTITTQQVKQVYHDTLGSDASSVQTAGTGTAQSIQVRSKALDTAAVAKLKSALFDKLQPKGTNGTPSQQVISDSAVSGSWGGEITRQALIALVVFLVLVTLFLTFNFERAMAGAALIKLVNDLVLTAGIYSIVGFEVSPATVIGLLTILGFSLYDTVVVFDKVKENTRGLLGLTRRTYGEAANLAVNQTLMRSINTSLIATLPVLGMLIIGAGLLGVGALKDLSLVQLTGIVTGTVSSICLATPLLVDLKMRNPAYQAQAERVAARRANLARKAATAASGTENGAAESTDAESTDAGSTDDETLLTALRQEKALAAAASVPSRTAKQGSRRARPGAKIARPTGKRKR
jgi:preprotein translocase subunit SecF